MIPLLAAIAAADDGPVEVHADLKSFGLMSFQEDTGLGEAIFDGRAKVRFDLSEHWRIEVHHAVSAVVGGALGLGAGATGVATGAPELVDLTWRIHGGAGNAALQGRTDRLLATGEVGPVTLTFGRQPLSFGSGLFFTPLDLVSPFFPATIDTEYKPGVDAVRVDAYSGVAFKTTAAAAWVGSCIPGTTDAAAQCDHAGVEDLAVASYTQVTVGVTDLGLFVAEIHDDEVVGTSVVSSVGPVGLHGDVAATFPPGHLDARDPTEDVFVRAVAGASLRPAANTSLSAEAYVQTNGAADPADYLLQAQGPRYARGELWALGRVYVAASVGQQIRPRLAGSLAVIVNAEDPSALVVPGLQISVAENVDVDAGAYIGLGPGYDDELGVLRSELGLVPVTGYVRMAAYF